MYEAALRRVLAPAELGLAAVAVVGAAVFSATAAFGRTSLFWPSERWAGAFAATLGLELALWWVAARAVPSPSQANWHRWHAAAWPFLAALPAAAAAAALYVDDRSNHLVATGQSTKPELVTYLALVFLTGQAAYWLAAPRRRTADGGRRQVSGGPPSAVRRHLATALLLAIAAAVYVHVSVFQRWPPFQIDFQVNLAAARELLAGHVPYRNDVPVWDDRVHQLPTTLAVLFGPLTLLPPDLAATLFFLGNQACWVAGVWLFIRRLVAPQHRTLWFAGALALGATFWPWQESINFGQPDGLLFLLFVWSMTAVAAGREV